MRASCNGHIDNQMLIICKLMIYSTRITIFHHNKVIIFIKRSKIYVAFTKHYFLSLNVDNSIS